ncbi:xanthine dehydrogenase family protein subunit M [Iamia sp. SCSIO 61187]|uniref:FAD binding domain-containing protein n=1 Tax=Iamia sp. SCSIO 61187 TaxID=2722752 RepID=UPI001C637D94|nr:xanthine dehydrogenase family protein subunit M [Iamia sp. SCSIO 61187]QYG94699.1 xanthine dehydrogenase family protein subunit M [Iamia sp. SCSIO 61187]
MIPAPFQYVRASSTDEAMAALAEHGDEAKLLAGGHSLLPLMKLRLASPEVLVDVGRISDLSYVRHDGDTVAIGALTTHHDAGRDEVLKAQVPLLAHVATQIGDPQVRHRGTVGGSIAHADPASDLPAALLALGGSVVVRSAARGERVIAASDFFTGFLEAALEPDELLVELRVPAVPDAGWSFQKFNRRALDWAIVGVAAVSRNGSSGVGLVNMGPTPLVAAGVAEAWSGGASPAEAAERVAEGTEPGADTNASVEYRTHLAKVLTRRALEEAGG